jgi:hypothetical protein
MCIEEDEKKDPDVITPIILPFIKSSGLKDETTINVSDSEEDYSRNKDIFELKEGEPFLIQFPRLLPYNIQHQTEQKKRELEDDADNCFNHNEFQSTFDGFKEDFNMGKLRIYSSGKMKLVIGDIEFDVSQGLKNSFAQELVYEEDDKLYLLGPMKPEKLIVSPNV